MNPASPNASWPRTSNHSNQQPFTDRYGAARHNSIQGQAPQRLLNPAGGWGSLQEPSYPTEMRPSYHPSVHRPAPYQQPSNSFPTQNQNYSYCPAQQSPWPEQTRPVYAYQASSSGNYSTEPRDNPYAEYNPILYTDPDGRSFGSRVGDRITITEGGRQELDPTFKVAIDHRKFFTEGRAFKLFWATPRGSNAPQSEPEGSVFDCGPNVHAKIQRFVVVKPDHSQGYSICLPISTNGGKGAAKKGLRQEEHTIVYTSAEAPSKLSNETHLHKTPIKVDLVNPSEKLDTLSRLNLGKSYPVEHNVKVCEVGEITGHHKRTLLKYYYTEMQKKIH